MTSVAVQVSELQVSFGGSTPILKSVTTAVAPGEFVALLGSSGCGKTTLLRSIAGFAPVDRGRIQVGDRDVTTWAPERRGTAMVFQSYALWPHMTAAQNIAYGLKLRRKPRGEIAARVAEMLGLLGLDDFGDRKVTQLSGGQRQRIALGRALAIDPEVLLLDEPLSNLDARIRLSVRHEIKALQSRLGITTIHVTHDREEAMVMADRIVVMQAGEIVQEGTPEDVYNRPNSRFVAEFMGADNTIDLDATIDGSTLNVAEGQGHKASTLKIAQASGEDGVNLPKPIAGKAIAHFRSEAASLTPIADSANAQLSLTGRIAEASYPGGFYRYGVDVGDRRFLIDHPDRLKPNEEVCVCLPESALHIFPTTDGC